MKMTTKETFLRTNIGGQSVEVFKLVSPSWKSEKTKKKHLERTWFCAYATLKGSENLSESFLGHPTYKEGDKVGVDTAHAFNEEQTLDEKLRSALTQIHWVINRWKEATVDGFYPEDGE